MKEKVKDIETTPIEETTPAEDKQEKKKGKSLAMKIINIVINVLIVLVLVTSILIATLALTSKANGGVPSIFGYSFHTIQDTHSMEAVNEKYPGGPYYTGDLVIGKVTNSNPNEVYEVGDIVVYTQKEKESPDGVISICHRIISRDTNDSGDYIYVTQGDNNEAADPDPITASQIVAVCYDHTYHGAVLKGFGGFLDSIRTPTGFFLAVLLPMIIFFMYEIIRVVINAINYRKSKEKDQKEDAEREKQEAVEAAVKAALEASGKSSSDADKPADMSEEQMEQFKQFLAFQEAQKAQKTEAAEAPAEEPAEEE